MPRQYSISPSETEVQAGSYSRQLPRLMSVAVLSSADLEFPDPAHLRATHLHMHNSQSPPLNPFRPLLFVPVFLSVKIYFGRLSRRLFSLIAFCDRGGDTDKVRRHRAGTTRNKSIFFSTALQVFSSLSFALFSLARTITAPIIIVTTSRHSSGRVQIRHPSSWNPVKTQSV